MNRSRLKLPCAVFVGVVLGWGIRGLPWWSGKAGEGKGWPEAQGGFSAGDGGGQRGSGGKADTTRTGERPNQERLKMLAAKFQNGARGGDAGKMRLAIDLAALSPEERGPVIKELHRQEGMAYSDIESLAVCWGMLDPQGALDYVLGQDGDMLRNPDILNPIWREFAKADLPAAKAALGRYDGEDRMHAEQQILIGLGSKDLRMALAYAREVGNEEGAMDALASMAVFDPLGVAAELPPAGKGLEAVVKNIAKSLLAKDRPGFEKWARSLNDPGHRAVARCAALTNDVLVEPELASKGLTEWLMEEPKASALAGDVSKVIAGNWMASGSPPAVADWADRLPEGAAREAAVAEVGRFWLESDMVRASAWLASLPPSAGKDSAVLGLVRKISQFTPEDAFEWACTIRTSHERDEALMFAVMGWAKQDPAAARQAVDGMPTAQRDNLREVLEMVKRDEEAKGRK